MVPIPPRMDETMNKGRHSSAPWPGRGGGESHAVMNRQLRQIHYNLVQYFGELVEQCCRRSQRCMSLDEIATPGTGPDRHFTPGPVHGQGRHSWACSRVFRAYPDLGCDWPPRGLARSFWRSGGARAVHHARQDVAHPPNGNRRVRRLAVSRSTPPEYHSLVVRGAASLPSLPGGYGRDRDRRWL